MQPAVIKHTPPEILSKNEKHNHFSNLIRKRNNEASGSVLRKSIKL